MTCRIKTAAIVVALLLAFGCEDDGAVFTSSIEGKWIGTLAEIEVKPFGLPVPIKEDDPSFNMPIEFTAEGNFLVLEGSKPIHGTYQLEGDHLNIETDYAVDDIPLAGTYSVKTLTETSLVIFLKRKGQKIDVEGAPAIRGIVKITLHFQRG